MNKKRGICFDASSHHHQRTVVPTGSMQAESSRVRPSQTDPSGPFLHGCSLLFLYENFFFDLLHSFSFELKLFSFHHYYLLCFFLLATTNGTTQYNTTQPTKRPGLRFVSCILCWFVEAGKSAAAAASTAGLTWTHSYVSKVFLRGLQ